MKLALGRVLYDLGDPMGKKSFNILATFAEFEDDLIRMRTGDGMAIARDSGKLRGKQPKLSNRQQRGLCRIHATGEHSINDLAELFSVSRPIVYPHSTGALPLSVRFCPLPESTRLWHTIADARLGADVGRMVGVIPNLRRRLITTVRLGDKMCTLFRALVGHYQ